MHVAITRVMFILVCPVWTKTEPNYLTYFIKTIGSLDPNVSSVNVFNGTVYGKLPGNQLQLIFLFEGYNINRKLAQSDGTYRSLSREFVVYRDPKTAEILRVWTNPWTNNKNEVFWVANDPVNGNLGKNVAADNLEIPGVIIGFNTDIILEYPNPLSPADYPAYSAGPIYDAAELFTFFANLTDLEGTRYSNSVPMTATWVRKSQYLPWMEMGTREGGLYYIATSWKCNEGLSCVADDIMQLVKEHHPEYQTAPTVDKGPNKTSWRVFKATIDQRRQTGLSDIIIPTVQTTANSSMKTNAIDNRVLNFLINNTDLRAEINGKARSEIYGKQSYNLFNINGFVNMNFGHLPQKDGYHIQLDGSVNVRDTNGSILKTWHNPITGKKCTVPNPFRIGVDLVFKNEHFFTIDMPSSRAVGLMGAQSTDNGRMPLSQGNHSVNFVNLIFGYDQLSILSVGSNSAKFYGTVSSFSNWPQWMDMNGISGNLVTKATIWRSDVTHHPNIGIIG